MADVWDENDIVGALITELTDRAVQCGPVLQQAALDVLTGPRSGRWYSRPGGGRYQASAPGEPPAERSGELRHSWTPLPPVVRVDGTGLTVTVALQTQGAESHAFYFDPRLSPYLPSQIAPRPFVGPIMERAEPGITAIFSQPLRSLA